MQFFHFWQCFFCFFFFPQKSWEIFCFFLWKSLHPTHSLDFKTGEKKNRVEKKKQHFCSLTRFLPKSGQNQTFPGKKKIRYLWTFRNFFLFRNWKIGKLWIYVKNVNYLVWLFWFFGFSSIYLKKYTLSVVSQ